MHTCASTQKHQKLTILLTMLMVQKHLYSLFTWPPDAAKQSVAREAMRSHHVQTKRCSCSR